MATISKCPGCGRDIPPDAAGDQCPQCLFLIGIEDCPPTGSGVAEASLMADDIFMPPEPIELQPSFPNYDVLEIIGHGGMGAVYKAFHRYLGRLVAIKILPPEIGRDPELAARFEREARALAGLAYPSIVSVYDSGRTPEGLLYLVMEFIEGADLQQLIHSGEIAPDLALSVVLQVCDALQYAHDQGVVHRDIKPSNILLDKDGGVHIADFGLVKLVSDISLSRLSRFGCTMGTPHYMAPEQRKTPNDVDNRADIFALGVVFYEMLTGELPHGRFAPPSQKTSIDPRIDNVVLRAMEPEAEKRYQQARNLKSDLERITSNGSGFKRGLTFFHRGRGRVTALGLGVLALLISLGTYALWETKANDAPDEEHGVAAAGASELETGIARLETTGARGPTRDEIRAGYLPGLTIQHLNDGSRRCVLTYVVNVTPEADGTCIFPPEGIPVIGQIHAAGVRDVDHNTQLSWENIPASPGERGNPRRALKISNPLWTSSDPAEIFVQAEGECEYLDYDAEGNGVFELNSAYSVIIGMASNRVVECNTRYDFFNNSRGDFIRPHLGDDGYLRLVFWLDGEALAAVKKRAAGEGGGEAEEKTLESLVSRTGYPLGFAFSPAALEPPNFNNSYLSYVTEATTDHDGAIILPATGIPTADGTFNVSVLNDLKQAIGGFISLEFEVVAPPIASANSKRRSLKLSHPNWLPNDTVYVHLLVSAGYESLRFDEQGNVLLRIAKDVEPVSFAIPEGYELHRCNHEYETVYTQTGDYNRVVGGGPESVEVIFKPLK